MIKLLVISALFAVVFSAAIDDEPYKVYISRSTGKLTKAILTTGKNVDLLDISFSTIEAVEPDAFCSLPNLKTISLNGNKFPKFSKQLFQCTPKLTTIVIDADGKQELDRDAFSGLKEVTYFRLNDIKIGRIGKDLFVDINPETLFMKGCQVTEIDSDSFCAMTNLKEMDLSYNQISSFKPGTFANLPKLGELLLNGNKIRGINWEQWNKLPSLVVLDFGDNPIVTCDASKFREYFPNIRSCNLGDSFPETDRPKVLEEGRKMNISFDFRDYNN